MSASREEALAFLKAKIATIEHDGSPLDGFRPAHTDENVDHQDRQTLSMEPATLHSGADGPDELQRAKRKIERLCSVREQSSEGLRTRLMRDGFSEEVAEQAVSWALKYSIVDDMRFADALVRSRLAAGKGMAGIRRELAAHGIDADNIALFRGSDAFGSDMERERAIALLQRKPPRAKNARDAAYRKLVQKGFSSDVASSAARAWFESQR